MVERTVFIHLPGETEAVPAGRLTMIEQGLQVQASTFAYGRRYVARANALPMESFLEGAVDPYLLIRDAYLQRRHCQIVDCSEEMPDYLLPDYDYEIPDFDRLP